MATPSFWPLKQPLTKVPLWHQVDAKGHRVGRLAIQIASLLMGKKKPIYNGGTNVGDYVVVYNAEHVIFTGKKWTQKLYRWHTRYPGGLKEVQAKDMFLRKPDSIIRRAVSGMLPKNKLRQERLRRLRIYVGSEHPHAQQVCVGKGYTFYKHQTKPKKVLTELEEEEMLKANALWKKEYPNIQADPEKYLSKWGGVALSFENTAEGMEAASRIVRGSEPLSLVDLPPRTTKHRRAKRMERLKTVVESIRNEVLQRKAKSEPILPPPTDSS